MKRKLDSSHTPINTPSIASWLSFPKESQIGSSNFNLKLSRTLKSTRVECPICGIQIMESAMNAHLDLNCLCVKRNPTVSLSKPELSLISEAGLGDVYIPGNPQFHEAGDIPGLWLMKEFITEEEENQLIRSIESDTNPWHHSTFNGHCLSKTYGLVTQFGRTKSEERIVRINSSSLGEVDMPQYLQFVLDRFKHLIVQSFNKGLDCKLPNVLRTFIPNECNANLYLKEAGHYLTPHYDDRFLSGPVLLNLSLCGKSVMTYTKGDSTAASDTFAIELPRRCLQIVTRNARFNFKHSIKSNDVVDAKRISVTFRQAGSSNGGLIRGYIPDDKKIPSIKSYLSSTQVNTMREPG